MSKPQSGCCRRRAVVADCDGTPVKGYTSRAERSAGFTKTRLCKFYLEGNCTRGKKCTFAHGEEDKTSQSQPLCLKLCKTLIATGRCKNQNCRYAHSKEDITSAKQQLTMGLVDGQEEHDVGQAITPSASECGHRAEEPRAPVTRGGLRSPGGVRWFGFLCNVRWVCNHRATQRVMVAPPGVLNPPVANSTAISHPIMQTTHSEPPPAHQLDSGSLSLPLEPAFQVVVKNTFIDVVETPTSASRSQSEPPRATSRKVEKKHRCLSGDDAELFGEQRFPVSDSLTNAPSTKVAESSFAEGQPQFFVSAGVLKDSTPPATDVELPQAREISIAPATKVAELSFTQEVAESYFTADTSTPDVVELPQAQKFPRGQDLFISDGTVCPWATELPTGELKVRNTFIEVCQSLHVPGALRNVRSAAGRLDQLAMEGQAIHQAQG